MGCACWQRARLSPAPALPPCRGRATPTLSTRLPLPCTTAPAPPTANAKPYASAKPCGWPLAKPCTGWPWWPCPWPWWPWPRMPLPPPCWPCWLHWPRPCSLARGHWPRPPRPGDGHWPWHPGPAAAPPHFTRIPKRSSRSKIRETIVFFRREMSS